MTPEQEILQDGLDIVLQRGRSFETELDYHARHFPILLETDWDRVSAEDQMHIAAFSKRFEMTQDQIVRRLFRSVLAVKGVRLRTRGLGDTITAMTALGVIDDEGEWHELAKVRNTLAHDYSLSPKELETVLNRAWTLSPRLLEMIARVKAYVDTNQLLASDELS